MYNFFVLLPFAVFFRSFFSIILQSSTIPYTVVVKQDCPFHAAKVSKIALATVSTEAVRAVNFFDIGNFHAFIVEGQVNDYLDEIMKCKYVDYIEPQTEIYTAAHEVHYESLQKGNNSYEISTISTAGTIGNEQQRNETRDNANVVQASSENKQEFTEITNGSQLNGELATGGKKLSDNNHSSSNIMEHLVIAQLNAPWNLCRICRRSTYSLSSRYCFDSYGCADIDAYVLDTGVCTSHQQFQGRAKYVANFSQEQSADDLNGHGTHVAGIIGAQIYGVCKNIQIKSIKILDRNGKGNSTSLFDALNWIAANHNSSRNSVVNLSISGTRSQALDSAITQLILKGIVVVVAAGNDGNDACKYSPSSATKSLAVAALTASDSLLTLPASNWGKCVDIYAPGAKIRSTYLNGSSITMSGTSMAAPHVTGGIASAWSRSGLKGEQVIKKLLKNGTDELIKGIPTGQKSKNTVLYVQP